MGTRHVISIFKDGEYKLAQYGQWDGYPTGQGQNIADFFKDINNIEKLKLNLPLLYTPSDEVYNKMVKDAGIEMSPEGWITMDMSKLLKETFPSMHRDTSAKILNLIANAKDRIPVRLDREFAEGLEGSFGCEWSYTLDFDRGVVDVFRGEMNLLTTIPFDGMAEYNMEILEKVASAIATVPEYYPTLDDFSNDYDYEITEKFMEMYNSVDSSGFIPYIG